MFFVEREEKISFFIGLSYSYNLMVNQSIVMLVSLTDNKLIIFNKIYNIFDKQNIFNSNWENELIEEISELTIKISILHLKN